MALNLNSKQAIEYSRPGQSLNLIDFESYGDFVFLFAGYEEHVGPEELGSKQADLIHVLVVSYTPTEGSTFSYSELEAKSIYLATDVTGKEKPMAEAEGRCIIAAIMGQTPTDPTYDAVKARKKLIAATEAGEVDPTADPMLFCLRRVSKPGKGKHAGKTFANDLFSVYEAG